MKDPHDNATIDALANRGRGRPREYQSAAEKQKAYRERKANVNFNYWSITESTKETILSNIELLKKGTYPRESLIYKSWGAFELWDRITWKYKALLDEDVIRDMLAGMEEE